LTQEPYDKTTWARDGQELSFKAGDMLEIITSSGDWWSARKIDLYGSLATGFVPFNYLALSKLFLNSSLLNSPSV
uniref:SH3 domain-containing protein n=1 Tax=Sinocyclocheilus anshuiensis TaxID=1608454 RepID=A0A671KIY7_9TELE